MDDFYEAGIGYTKSYYYLPKFNKYDAGGSKASWNWPAFFVTLYWLLYRKMWLYAFLYFFASIPFSIIDLFIPDGSLLSTVLWLAYLVGIFIILPIYANSIYHNHVRNKIFRTMNRVNEKEKALKIIEKEGGTSNIVLIIFLLMIFPAILGILAAIAIPAYQDYTARAQVTEGIALSSYHKIAVAEYYADHHSFVGISSEDIKGQKSGKYVERIDILPLADDKVSIVVTFKQSDAVTGMIRGKEFRTASEDGGRTWKCGYRIGDTALAGTNQVNKKYMPKICR